MLEKRMSKKEMINELVEQDIDDIRQAIYQDDFEFLDRVLKGEGFVPYNKRDMDEIKQEYIARIIGE
jgi:SOS response regulatory protein OraA/RecX